MIIDFVKQLKDLEQPTPERKSGGLQNNEGQVVSLSTAVKMRSEQRALQAILARANKQRL